MSELLVYYRKKLIGTYCGEVLGDEWCILRTLWPDGSGGYKHIIATLLFDRRDKLTGLELAWDDGIELFEEFKPLAATLPAPPPKAQKRKRTRMRRQLSLPF